MLWYISQRFLGVLALVEILSGPFTVQAKEARIQKEVRENYESYFARAAKTRMWVPHKLEERQEMMKNGKVENMT